MGYSYDLHVKLITPMGLNKDFINNINRDGFCFSSDSFDKAGDAEVSASSQVTISGADDEGERLHSEYIVSKSGFIELSKDKGFHVIGIEPEEVCREGNS